MAFESCAAFFEGNASAIADCSIAQGVGGGVVGGFLAVMVLFGILALLLFVLAVYIYHALAWATIARKMKHKRPWLSWIPFASTSMRLELGGFHWAWIFLLLVPILGWAALFVLVIISTWRAFEERKYPGWFSLSLIVPKVGVIFYMVVIGFVAWKDKKRKLFR